MIHKHLGFCCAFHAGVTSDKRFKCSLERGKLYLPKRDSSVEVIYVDTDESEDRKT